MQTSERMLSPRTSLTDVSTDAFGCKSAEARSVSSVWKLLGTSSAAFLWMSLLIWSICHSAERGSWSVTGTGVLSSPFKTYSRQSSQKQTYKTYIHFRFSEKIVSSASSCYTILCNSLIAELYPMHIPHSASSLTCRVASKSDHANLASQRPRKYSRLTCKAETRNGFTLSLVLSATVSDSALAPSSWSLILHFIGSKLKPLLIGFVQLHISFADTAYVEYLARILMLNNLLAGKPLESLLWYRFPEYLSAVPQTMVCLQTGELSYPRILSFNKHLKLLLCSGHCQNPPSAGTALSSHTARFSLPLSYCRALQSLTLLGM